MDAIKNFARSIVNPISDSDTTVTGVDIGSRFPDPAVEGEYNMPIWNVGGFPNPADDPEREIVRVTAKSGNTLTIVRGQEGTTAKDHNIVDGEFMVILTVTKETFTSIKKDMAMVVPVGSIINMPLSKAEYNLESDTNGDFIDADGRSLDVNLEENKKLYSIFGSKYGSVNSKNKTSTGSLSGSFYTDGATGVVKDFDNENRIYMDRGGNKQVMEYEFNQSTNVLTYLRILTMPVGLADNIAGVETEVKGGAMKDTFAMSGLFWFVSNSNYIYAYKRNSADGTSFASKGNSPSDSYTNQPIKIIKETTDYIFIQRIRQNGSNMVGRVHRFNKNDNTWEQGGYTTLGIYSVSGFNVGRNNLDSETIVYENSDDAASPTVVVNLGDIGGKIFRVFTHRTRDEFIIYTESQKLIKIFKTVGGVWTHEIISNSIYSSFNREYTGWYDDIFIERTAIDQPEKKLNLFNDDGTLSFIDVEASGLTLPEGSKKNNFFILIGTDKMVGISYNKYFVITGAEYNNTIDINTFNIPTIAGADPSTTNNGYPYIKRK